MADFEILSGKLDESNVEEILFCIPDDKLCILVENHRDKYDVIFKHILSTSFRFLLNKYQLDKNFMVDIAKHLDMRQMHIYKKYIELNDHNFIENVIRNMSIDVVKYFILSLDKTKCLELVTSARNSESVPSFLEICISINFIQLRRYFFKFFVHFTVDENINFLT